MGSGGSSSPNYTPYSVDPTQLNAWLSTAAGKQYAGSYNPTSTYAQGSNGQFLALPSNSSGNGQPFNVTQGSDVTGMINAFNSWVAGNAQTQANWGNYAEAAAANEGGEGDQTITSGPAQGQRQQLLGTLANAGNPTTPTPGLGTMAMPTGNTALGGKS